MSIEDEVRRLRQEADDAGRKGAEEARAAQARAVMGQERLRQLGQEILHEYEKHTMPSLVRFRLTPKLFSSDLFRIESVGDRVWLIGDGLVVTPSGLICSGLGVWRPGDLSTPQDRRRNKSLSYYQAKKTDEPGQCARLAESEGAVGLYEDKSEIYVSGSRPVGAAGRDDLKTGIWFEGTEIMTGDEQFQKSYREHVLKLAAAAIVGASGANAGPHTHDA
jgi:hypothetical protein